MAGKKKNKRPQAGKKHNKAPPNPQDHDSNQQEVTMQSPAIEPEKLPEDRVKGISPKPGESTSGGPVKQTKNGDSRYVRDLDALWISLLTPDEH